MASVCFYVLLILYVSSLITSCVLFIFKYYLFWTEWWKEAHLQHQIWHRNYLVNLLYSLRWKQSCCCWIQHIANPWFILQTFPPTNGAPSLVKLLDLNNNNEKVGGKIGEGGERDTKTVMTEASNPGNAILIRVQWIKVSLLTRESFPARHSTAQGPGSIGLHWSFSSCGWIHFY